MSDERPKLFANKPKKSKLKASKPITTVPPPPPPPLLPKKEPFFQRFKLPLPPALERFRFLVPFVLVINFTIGANLKTSTPIATASSSSMAAAAAPPPPPPTPPQPQGSSARSYKLFGKLVLGFSFFTGAYVLLRTVMKDEEKSEEVKPGPTSSSSVTPVAAISEKAFALPIVEPIQRPPIPEDQQRALFKWLLDEKRKVKPKDAQERKRIDEEKAILKQFISAKSLPSI